MLATLLRGSRSNRAVDKLVPSKDAGAIMAVESARVVLVDHDDEPQVVHEVEGGFVVLGAKRAVAMVDGGLDVEELDAATASALRGDRARGQNRAEVVIENVPSPGKLLPIDNPVYATRQKLPKYNVQVSPLSAHGSDTGKLLAGRLPGWTKADHLQQAELHTAEADRMMKEWGKVANDAAKETFGRPYQATDYRISGIASDQFSDEKKEQLRKLAAGQSRHKDAAYAHASAAKLRRVPKDKVQEAFASGEQLQALLAAAQGKNKVEIGRLTKELTRKGYAEEVEIVLRVAREGGDWDDVLDALSEDLREVIEPKNTEYGFYGTIASAPSTELAKKAWAETLPRVMKAFKLNAEEARAVLDASIGRHWADAWLDGNLDDGQFRGSHTRNTVTKLVSLYREDPDGYYAEGVSESPVACIASPEYPIYTGINFDLSDLLLIPESGKSMVPYDLVDAVRRYVDTSPAVMRERRELARRVRAALEKDERFQTLLRENGLAMKSRHDESVVDEGADVETLSGAVNVGAMVTSGKARTATPRVQLGKFTQALDAALDPDSVLEDAVVSYFSTREGLALLDKYGYNLVESRLSAWTNPQNPNGSTMKTQEYADLVLGENGVELVNPEIEHVYATVECDVDDEAAVATAVEQLEAAADENGFEETPLDEGGDSEALTGEVFDEFEFDLVADIGTDLADLSAEHGIDKVMDQVTLFDEAVAECNYEAAVSLAETIAAALGEAALTEFKRRRGRALSTFRRSLKVQTSAEKMRNRKARKAYKTNPALRRKAKMYRKKFKRFLRNSTEPSGRVIADDVEVIEVDLPPHMRENYASDAHQKSFDGKAATNDALIHAAMGFFGGTIGQTHAFAGLSASMEASGYTGVSGATDTQMMSILGRLVSEGVLLYVPQAGFTANADSPEFGDDKGTPIATLLGEKYVGFKKLKAKIAAKGGATDPGAVTASIGRKKYGKGKFQAAAAAGRKMGHESEEGAVSEDDLLLARAAKKSGLTAVVTVKSGQPLFFEDMAAANEFWKSLPAKLRGAKKTLVNYLSVLGAEEDDGEGEAEETVTEGLDEQEGPGKVVIRPATDVDGTKGREVVVVWTDGREEDLKGSTGSTRNFVSDDEANPQDKIDALVTIARAIAAGEAPN
jgi:hypothetical protein